MRYLKVAATIMAICLGAAGVSRAQGVVTFVSGSGDDSNNCLTVATPCRQLGGATGALSKTAETGTVHVLSGNYAPVIIDKSVSIIAEQGLASIGSPVLVKGNNSGGNRVRLQGLVLEGVSFSTGAGSLFIEDCSIAYGGGAQGIHFEPSGSRGSLFVRNTSMSNTVPSPSFAVFVAPTGAASVDVVLDQVGIDTLGDAGVSVLGQSSTGTINLTLRNSTIAVGRTTGLRAADDGNGATNVMIEGSSLVSNGAAAVAALGSKTTIRVRNSTITANGRGLNAGPGAKIISFGGNVLAGNAIDGAFTSTDAAKVAVEGSTFSNNKTRGVQASGSNATVRMRNSTVTANDRGLDVAAGGTIISHGGNVVAGNTGNGAFTSTVAQQ